MITQNSKLFSERQAHFVRQGLTGRAVFEALAADDVLPASFDEKDLAAIAGVTTHAIKMRRARGSEPSFLKLSRKCIRYPRESACSWLASMYHDRRAG